MPFPKASFALSQLWNFLASSLFKLEQPKAALTSASFSQFTANKQFHMKCSQRNIEDCLLQ